MASYYLDIETTGLDPGQGKIITLQYQELARGTGSPAGDLHILKEWELGEKGVLERFVADTGVTSTYGFDFVPVGYNLRFEHRYLMARAERHGVQRIDLLSGPYMDLHSTGVLMNGGEFKDSGLDKMTGKRQSGASVPDWYRDGEYGRIEEYIADETREFVRFYRWLLGNMPGVHARFMASIGQ